MGWSSIIKGAGSAISTAAGKTAKATGGVVLHPQQTVRGAASAVKTGVVGAATGYVGWQTLVNDKSVVETVSDMAVGEKTTDRIAGAIDSVTEAADKASETMDGVKEATSSLDGISSFFRNIFSGNGVDMLGSLFHNIGSGNVSGMSMVGLAAAALLSFGRFGWMGKIAGLLMGALLIGNNSRVAETASNTYSQSASQQQEQAQGRGMRR